VWKCQHVNSHCHTHTHTHTQPRECDSFFPNPNSVMHAKALAFFQRNNPRPAANRQKEQHSTSRHHAAPCVTCRVVTTVCGREMQVCSALACRVAFRACWRVEAGNGGCLPDAMIGKLQQYRLPVGSRMPTVVGKSRGSSGDPHRRVLKTKAAPNIWSLENWTS
jgi:hypothetical protein